MDNELTSKNCHFSLIFFNLCFHFFTVGTNELTSFLGGTDAEGHDVGGYDTRVCSRTDAGGGSDVGGNDTDESRT